MNQHAAYLSAAAVDLSLGLVPERLADPKGYDFVLTSSVKKYAVFALAWGFTCVAITWALLFMPQPQENRDVAPWVLLVWYAVEAGFIAKIIRPSRLSIDAGGFTFTRLWRPHRVAWSECVEFGVFKPAKGLPMVVVKRRLASGAKAETVLPENYGLPAVELAEVLQQLCARTARRS